MNFFVLDENTNSRVDLKLRITKPPSQPLSTRIIENISIEGRAGTLTVLKGWEDISFDFEVALISDNLRQNYRTVSTNILSAETIYFSNDNKVYYNIKYSEIGQLDIQMATLGTFAIKFTCLPFKYQRNVGVITATSSGTLSNPGTIYSHPRIKVYGTGRQTLTINGEQIILNFLNNYLMLDSELKECYYGNVAQNQNMIGDFPVFEVGSNTFEFDNKYITSIEIEPRWRYI